MNSMYSLSEYEIKKILEDKLKENPDIFYYIDNYYLQKVIDSLVEGIAEAMSQNNEKLVKNITNIVNDDLRRQSRFLGR